MKLELSHDILAKKVGDKITGEEKRFRAVQSFLNKRYEEYRERGNAGLLGKDDIEHISPYLNKLELNEDVSLYILLSKNKIRRKKFFIGTAVSTVSAVILIFSLISIYNSNLIAERKRRAELTISELSKKEEKLKGINEALVSKRREATESEKDADMLSRKLAENKKLIVSLESEYARKQKLIASSFKRMREDANNDDSEYRKWISNPSNWSSEQGELSWNEAKRKCSSLGGGFRLPSRKDWLIIYSTNNSVFQKWKSSGSIWYWTGDERTSSEAFGFLPDQGVSHFDDKSVRWHVRCVK